jgi:hypothetical protein
MGNTCYNKKWNIATATTTWPNPYTGFIHKNNYYHATSLLTAAMAILAPTRSTSFIRMKEKNTNPILFFYSSFH